MRKIIIIAHNLRSSHNVGSLLRTADAMGVEKVYLTGYTPYPKSHKDQRLPHIANKVHKAIIKTALGAEDSVRWQRQEDIFSILNKLIQNEYTIIGLEQADNSIQLNSYQPEDKIALIIGREVDGIETEVLKHCHKIVEIPMLGKKESLNVVQATAMALYHCRFD